MPKGPKTVTRRHPRGDKGTKVSVAEVVKKIEEGRKDKRVRAWAVETVRLAGLDGFGADKMKQAQAVLERLRVTRGYVEDPKDTEFIPSAACTLAGCDGLTFLGEDCDGLVVAYVSAIEALNIEGAVVAHSYDPHRTHSHVLAAVRDEKRGRWVRCDPSTKDPFGTVNKPTRETFYGIPGGNVLSDTNGPADVSKVPTAPMRPEGDFVGVGRPGGGMVGEELETAQPALEGISEAFYQEMVEHTARMTRETEAAFNRLRFRHEQLVQACAMMNEIAGGGYELVEPDVADTDGGGEKLPRWTAAFEAYYLSFERYVPAMIKYGQEVASGKRMVAWDENGEYGKQHGLGYTESSVVVIGEPGEPYVGIDEEDKKILVKATQAPGGSVGEPLTVGALVLIVGGVVVLSVAGYFVVKEVAEVLNNKIAANEAMRQRAWLTDMAERHGPEQAQEMLDEINKGAIQKAEAKIEKDKASPFSQVAKTAESGLNALVIIGLGAAAVYGITVAADLIKTRRAKAKA